MRIIATLLFLIPVLVSAQQEENRYAYYRNGLWGYIDSTGKEVIKPQFHNAGYFSNGLAPARKGEYFGFIDRKGKFAIKEQYEFAQPFENGIALVHSGRKPYLVDLKGRIQFGHSYTSIRRLEGTLFLEAGSPDETVGLIDAKGNVAFSGLTGIRSFVGGYAVLERTVNPYTDSTETYSTVIDSTGKVIIPEGKYGHMSDFEHGYFSNSDYRDDAREYLFDREGQKVFTIPGDVFISDHYLSEGKIAVMYYDKTPDSIRMKRGYNRVEEHAVLDSVHNVIFRCTGCMGITPFTNNRAFVENSDRTQYMIDQYGNTIAHPKILDLKFEGYRGDPNDLFRNGKTIVKLKEGWYETDTNGVIVGKAPEEKKDDEISRELQSRVAMSLVGKYSGYMADYSYVNRKGEVVMKFSTPFEPANSDGMCESWFIEENQYSLSVETASDTSAELVLIRTENGITVSLRNYAADSLEYPVQDGTPFIFLQALNEEGEWEFIQNMYPSDCGNSYYSQWLAAKTELVRSYPNFEGGYKTRLRAIAPVGDRGSTKKILSNEIEGSINRSQFWNKDSLKKLP